MQNNGNGANDELSALIDAAIHLGSDGRRIVQLAREHGWRPFDDAAPQVEVLEGVLANGTHVPIRIHRSPRQHVTG